MEFFFFVYRFELCLHNGHTDAMQTIYKGSLAVCTTIVRIQTPIRKHLSFKAHSYSPNQFHLIFFARRKKSVLDGEPVLES